MNSISLSSLSLLYTFSFCIIGLDQTNKSKKARHAYSRKPKVIGLITTIHYTKMKQCFTLSFFICHDRRIQTHHYTSQSSSKKSSFSSNVMNIVEPKEASWRRQNFNEPWIMITYKLIDPIYKVREETQVKESEVRVIFSSRLFVPWLRMWNIFENFYEEICKKGLRKTLARKTRFLSLSIYDSPFFPSSLLTKLSILFPSRKLICTAHHPSLKAQSFTKIIHTRKEKYPLLVLRKTTIWLGTQQEWFLTWSILHTWNKRRGSSTRRGNKAKSCTTAQHGSREMSLSLEKREDIILKIAPYSIIPFH